MCYKRAFSYGTVLEVEKNCSMKLICAQNAHIVNAIFVVRGCRLKNFESSNLLPIWWKMSPRAKILSVKLVHAIHTWHPPKIQDHPRGIRNLRLPHFLGLSSIDVQCYLQGFGERLLLEILAKHRMEVGLLTSGFHASWMNWNYYGMFVPEMAIWAGLSNWAEMFLLRAWSKDFSF